MTKPTHDVTWGVATENTLEPSAGQKASGYLDTDDESSSANWNYLWNGEGASIHHVDGCEIVSDVPSAAKTAYPPYISNVEPALSSEDWGVNPLALTAKGDVPAIDTAPAAKWGASNSVPVLVTGLWCFWVGISGADTVLAFSYNGVNKTPVVIWEGVTVEVANLFWDSGYLFVVMLMPSAVELAECARIVIFRPSSGTLVPVAMAPRTPYLTIWESQVYVFLNANYVDKVQFRRVLYYPTGNTAPLYYVSIYASMYYGPIAEPSKVIINPDINISQAFSARVTSTSGADIVDGFRIGVRSQNGTVYWAAYQYGQPHPTLSIGMHWKWAAATVPANLIAISADPLSYSRHFLAVYAGNVRSYSVTNPSPASAIPTFTAGSPTITASVSSTLGTYWCHRPLGYCYAGPSNDLIVWYPKTFGSTYDANVYAEYADGSTADVEWASLVSEVNAGNLYCAANEFILAISTPASRPLFLWPSGVGIPSPSSGLHYRPLRVPSLPYTVFSNGADAYTLPVGVPREGRLYALDNQGVPVEI